MEQNDDWVLRDLKKVMYPGNAITHKQIPTSEKLIRTFFHLIDLVPNISYNLYQEQFKILNNQISEEKFTT